MSEDERRTLELFLKCGSIRKTAIKLGGLKKRREIRKILRKCYEELKKIENCENTQKPKDFDF
jgi:hypothetical protein